MTLCLIARDEERFLAACLDSVRDAVDEIVVVDTGSVDGTERIAREAGAVVVHQPWREDFAFARNRALEAATGDWILVLDADERLARGADAIRRFVVRDDVDCGLLLLHDAARLDASDDDVLSGRVRQAEPVLLPRLLRRTPDLHWRGCVHEDVDGWLEARVGRMRSVGADLVHLGAVAAFRSGRQKGQRNLRLLQRRLDQEPDHPGLWVHFGHELASAGDRVGAKQAADRGWQLVLADPTSRTGHAIPAFTLLGRLQWADGDLPGLAETTATLTRFPGASTLTRHPNVLFLGGVAAEGMAAITFPRKRRWALLGDAARAFDQLQAGAFGPSTASVMPGVSGALGALRLATVLVQLGHFEEAVERFGSLSDHPRLGGEARLGQAEASIGLGDAPRALALLEQAPPGPDATALAARAHRLRGEPGLDTGDPGTGWIAPHRARLRAHSDREARDGVAPVFVAGAVRSGVAWLGELLAVQPQLAPAVGLDLVEDLMELRERRIALDLDVAFGAFLEQALRLASQGEGRPVIAVPHAALHLEALAHLLPGARFVHVVRDGRSVVASLLRRPWIDPDTRQPVSHGSSATAAARYWAEVVQCARQDHAAILGAVLEVRYEALFADPAREIARVAAFLGTDVLVSVAAASHPPSACDLDADALAAVEAECGHLLAELGYCT